jgi:hypothetical protein
MSRKTIPPDLRQLIDVIADALEIDNRNRSNRLILNAVNNIRRARHPKARQRPGPKLPNPIPIFLACEEVLESNEAEKSWDQFTLRSITVLVQKRLNSQSPQLVYSSATLRPYVQWFIYFILVWDDVPPRLRYKIHTVENVEHWHDADVTRLNATRRLAAFPRHPRRVLGFTEEQWTRFTDQRREDLLKEHFIKRQSLSYSPALKNRLVLATVLFVTRSRRSLLWESANYFKGTVS